jgi:hypothetical protein
MLDYYPMLLCVAGDAGCTEDWKYVFLGQNHSMHHLEVIYYILIDFSFRFVFYLLRMNRNK